MTIRELPRALRCGPVGWGRPLRRLRRLCRPVALVILGVGPLACAPTEALKPVVPVRGRIEFDGKPAAGALVVFHPTGDPVPNALDPRAVVEADGSFAISTHNARDGAPAGRYAVTVHDLQANPAPGEGPPVATGKRLPLRYTEPTRSGLQAEVRPDSANIFTFQLTR